VAVYAIGAVSSVNVPAGFAAYQEKAGPTLAQYGGQLVAGGTNVEVMDGNWSPVGMVVIEFESMDAAKTWYTSPEYSAAKPERLRTANSGLIFLDAG
jgi:uncharacterized protein (DUF1330 family)